jgi:hypothetical protein
LPIGERVLAGYRKAARCFSTNSAASGLWPVIFSTTLPVAVAAWAMRMKGFTISTSDAYLFWISSRSGLRGVTGISS